MVLVEELLQHVILFHRKCQLLLGLFDTVASFGLIHKNDVSQLNLKMGAKPNKVVHLIASDEYRENFKLTNIDSTIKQDEFLYRIQEQMLKFALENDGINSISFKISDITKLHELRHSYLHLSDSPDDNFVNQANYEKEDGRFKKRDVLKG